MRVERERSKERDQMRVERGRRKEREVEKERARTSGSRYPVADNALCDGWYVRRPVFVWQR